MGLINSVVGLTKDVAHSGMNVFRGVKDVASGDRDRRFQKTMYEDQKAVASRALQTRMADAKAAGLNPYLLEGGAQGAITPSVPSSSGGGGNALVHLATSILPQLLSVAVSSSEAARNFASADAARASIPREGASAVLMGEQAKDLAETRPARISELMSKVSNLDASTQELFARSALQRMSEHEVESRINLLATQMGIGKAQIGELNAHAMALRSSAAVSDAQVQKIADERGLIQQETRKGELGMTRLKNESNMENSSFGRGLHYVKPAIGVLSDIGMAALFARYLPGVSSSVMKAGFRFGP